MYVGPLFRIRVVFPLLQHEVFARDALPDVMNVFNNSLKVRRGVIGAGDENIVFHPRGGWCVEGADGYESSRVCE
jgi:hypothetical protein